MFLHVHERLYARGCISSCLVWCRFSCTATHTPYPLDTYAVWLRTLHRAPSGSRVSVLSLGFCRDLCECFCEYYNADQIHATTQEVQNYMICNHMRGLMNVMADFIACEIEYSSDNACQQLEKHVHEQKAATMIDGDTRFCFL